MILALKDVMSRSRLRALVAAVVSVAFLAAIVSARQQSGAPASPPATQDASPPAADAATEDIDLEAARRYLEQKPLPTRRTLLPGLPLQGSGSTTQPTGPVTTYALPGADARSAPPLAAPRIVCGMTVVPAPQGDQQIVMPEPSGRTFTIDRMAPNTCASNAPAGGQPYPRANLPTVRYLEMPVNPPATPQPDQK
jgi:hypothetical protein